MKNGRKMLVYAAGGIVLALAARAEVKFPGEPAEKTTKALSSDNPYGAIVERNIFDLHDPPPAHDPKDDKPKEPPSNIKLNGITTIFGNKQALFTVNKPGAAGKQPTTRSLILREGQRSEELEVLEINPKARTARIISDEKESLIHIETNKVASSGPAPAGPGGGAGGGAPGAHVPPYGQPGGRGAGFQPGGGNIPSRPLRTEAAPSEPQPNFSSAGAAPPQYGSYGASPVTQPTFTPEEQYTLMEAQKAQAQAAGDPVALIFPPTPLSQSEPQQQASPNPAPTAPTPGSSLPASLQPKYNGAPIP